MEKIPVVFSINNGYVKQLATVIMSILKNSNSKFDFNVLHRDITCDNMKKLESMLKKYDNAEIKFYNISDYLKNQDLESFMSRRKEYNYISIETYFRFFIPDIFKQYDKVIYLDSDILVFTDLFNLYNIDLKDNYLGAIQDTFLELAVNNPKIKTSLHPKISYSEYFKKYLYKQNNKYFNAGILLFNVKKMREDDITLKLFDFALKNSPLEFQDQCVLNAVLEKSTTYIDYRWNVLKDLKSYINLFPQDKKNIFEQIYKNPYIFHYVWHNKPWLIHDDYNYSFITEWWKYYKMTPFFDKKDSETFKIISKRIKPSLLKSIFSVRNCNNHKVITIFGIKIKFKSKIRRLENELNYLKSRIDKYEEDREMFITLIKNSKLDIEELESLIEEKENA